MMERKAYEIYATNRAYGVDNAYVMEGHVLTDDVNVAIDALNEFMKKYENVYYVLNTETTRLSRIMKLTTNTENFLNTDLPQEISNVLNGIF